jgi:hypothetical protein
VGTDPAELVRTGETTEYDPVVHVHVPGKCHIVGHDCLVADDAVVRDMHISHDPVVVADYRIAEVLHGATADRRELANRIAIADQQACWLVGILLVLRVVTYRGELVNVVILADRRGPVDYDVAVDPRTTTDYDIVPDHRVRPDLSISGNIRAVGNNCGGMNHDFSISAT